MTTIREASTKTTFASVAHLYIGCRIQVAEDFDARYKKGDIHEMSHLMLAIVFIGNIKFIPILRKLSDMTEGEKNELRVVMRPSWGAGNLLPKIESGKHLELFINKNEPTVFLYLLSKHFDLFGLIESGQAIDASTTPELLTK